MSFLLTCKEESHPWIAEQVRFGEGEEHLRHRYSWVNGIENRAEGEKLVVNYLQYELYNERKGEVTYRNSWITNHVVNSGTVRNIADCAHARWKIENEHNNGLKHHGYNLEHNFVHGKEHANELCCLLNLLAFLFHGIQVLVEDEYRKAYTLFGRKEDFFWALRYETARYFHENRHDLFLTVSGIVPDG